MELVLAGLAYVQFVIQSHLPPLWLALEVIGLLLYAWVRRLGVRGPSWWLVAGWALHPVWDLALHFFGPGRAFAPETYTVACLTWDRVIAGLLALAIQRRSASRPSLTLNSVTAAER